MEMSARVVSMLFSFLEANHGIEWIKYTSGYERLVTFL